LGGRGNCGILVRVSAAPMDESLESAEYAYLTTIGHLTGRTHRIEIWFVAHDGSVWVNAGARESSHWVQNLMADRRLELQIGSRRWSAVATIHPDLAEHPARRALAARYQGWEAPAPLSAWATDGLLVQIEPER
jgi:hypothetical protein